MESLLSRIESLAASLRSFESGEEKVEAAEELSGLVSELAEKLRRPVPPKGKG